VFGLFHGTNDASRSGHMGFPNRPPRRFTAFRNALQPRSFQKHTLLSDRSTHVTAALRINGWFTCEDVRSAPRQNLMPLRPLLVHYSASRTYTATIAGARFAPSGGVTL
jgi:hypothetical protein